MINTQSQCNWKTDIITMEEYNNNWFSYRNKLYEIFKRDFIDNILYYKGKEINCRIDPIHNNYEYGFIHLTEKKRKDNGDWSDRIPDFRRCERIEWNKLYIEHYLCNKTCHLTSCKGIEYYEFWFHSKIRLVFISIEDRFKVILEKRTNYYLLITGYYIDEENIKSEEKRIEKFKQQKTPLD